MGRFPGDGRGIGAAFSPDGKFLVAAGGHQGTTLWDVETGRVLGQLASLSYNEGLAAAFTPKNKQLITAGWGGHQQAHPVSVWDVAKRQRLRSLDEDVNDLPINAMAVAPDGKTLALATGMGRRNPGSGIVFWDLTSGDEIGRLDGLVNVRPARGRFVSAGYQALAYSPDGRTLAALLDGRVLFVELATRKVRSEISFGTAPQGLAELQGMPRLGALAFAPDGRTLAVGCSDGAIRRFDLRTGRELAPLPGTGSAIITLCWAPDGKRVRSYSMDGRLAGWRVGVGREWEPKSGPLSDAALEELWDALRGDDARDLFGAREALAVVPAQAVPFLRKRLAPAPKADAERLERLVTDLQGDYNARRKAVRELRKIGSSAVPALQGWQAKGGYDELIQRLMFELASVAPSAEQVRAVRAVGVLERVGNADARKLLTELAGGSAEAALTVQASAALERLGKVEPAKAPPAPEALWTALAGEDGVAAYQAVRALANRPATAKLLCDRLKEMVAKDTFDDDPERVAKLIGELDDKAFAVRDRANKDLASLGRLALPALRKALAGKVDLEPKRRLEQLVETAEKGGTSLEMLRVGRALEALELMNGPEAREALEALKDVRAGWLREAVRAALRRQR